MDKGDLVFTEDGQQVEYIAELGGEYFVRPQLTTDDEEPWFGDPFTVSKVFASAPRQVYDQTIADLSKRIEALEEQKYALEDEIRKSKTDETERKKRIMVNSALKRIDDFIAGKITHIVFGSYDIRVETFDEAVRYKDSDYERIPSQLKLLVLFGNSKGNLEWGLNRYSDGSGSYDKQVFPCFSYEDAVEKAKELIEAKYEIYRAEAKQIHQAEYGVTASLKLGIAIPDDIKEAVRNYLISQKQGNVRNMQELLDKANAELAKVSEI